MKVYVDDEKTHVDPCPHNGHSVGWTVMTETSVLIQAGFQIQIIEVHALLSDKTPLAHQFFTGHISRLNAMNFDIAAGVKIIYCMLSSIYEKGRK